ncbi:unnamed protein product [Discosporangium mesarthrocarpum]
MGCSRQMCTVECTRCRGLARGRAFHRAPPPLLFDEGLESWRLNGGIMDKLGHASLSRAEYAQPGTTPCGCPSLINHGLRDSLAYFQVCHLPAACDALCLEHDFWLLIYLTPPQAVPPITDGEGDLPGLSYARLCASISLIPVVERLCLFSSMKDSLHPVLFLF